MYYVVKLCGKENPYVYHNGEQYTLGSKKMVEENMKNNYNNPFAFIHEEDAIEFSNRMAKKFNNKTFIKKIDVHADPEYLVMVKKINGQYKQMFYWSENEAIKEGKRCLLDINNSSARVLHRNYPKYDLVAEL